MVIPINPSRSRVVAPGNADQDFACCRRNADRMGNFCIQRRQGNRDEGEGFGFTRKSSDVIQLDADDSLLSDNVGDPGPIVEADLPGPGDRPVTEDVQIHRIDLHQSAPRRIRKRRTDKTVESAG